MYRSIKISFIFNSRPFSFCSKKSLIEKPLLPLPVNIVWCVSDEDESGEEARFVPWGALVDCVSHENRCSTTWATQRHH